MEDEEVQIGQVDEESSNRDIIETENHMDDEDDYEEPPWPETLSQRITTKSEEILKYLEEIEPMWILEKNSEASEVLNKLLENLIGNNRNPEASQIVQKREELRIVGIKMLEYELWLCAHTEEEEDSGQALRVLKERCTAVRTSVEYARQGIMYISNSIGAIGGNSDYIIPVETINTSINTYIAPVQLNDDLLREAIAEFNRFTLSVGPTRNIRKNQWNIKAEAVYDLQTFLREKLAVKTESFCLLNEEIVRNEAERRLTDHEIYWKEHGAEDLKIIPWTKLLKARGHGYVGNLGVIAKDREILKTLLNNLYEKNLYRHHNDSLLR